MDYSSEVRRRFSAPVRAGDILPDAGPVFEGTAEDRSLNVWVRFQVRLEGEVIGQVRFRAYGCPHTLAAAEFVAGQLEGQSIGALSRIEPQVVARELDLPRDKLGKLLRIEDALSECHKQALVGEASRI